MTNLLSARGTRLIALAASLAALQACGGERVLVPPRVDLSGFERIGIVEITVNEASELGPLTTQKLMQAVQSAQPGTPILELGTEKDVLAAVGHPRLNAEAVRALGAHYGVDAVFVGHLEMDKFKPKFNVSTFLTAMSARADAEGALSTRLMETGGGATVWTASAEASAPVASLGVSSEGASHIGASDPEKAYGALIEDLVHRVTWDFRAHYERR